MQLVGIDLAWHCDKHPTAIALGALDNGVLSVVSVEASVLSVDEIVQRIDLASKVAGAVTGIAIDASLIIPNRSGQRACETAISKHYGARGAGCHASNTTLYPAADSVALSRRLESSGFAHLNGAKWQIECYPHPAIIEIFGLARRLRYKKGRVADRKVGQKVLAGLVSGLSDNTVLPLRIDSNVRKPLDGEHIESLRGRALKSNEDTLDAVICLYIAGLYAIKAPGRVFGTVQDGYIWVPQAG